MLTDQDAFDLLKDECAVLRDECKSLAGKVDTREAEIRRLNEGIVKLSGDWAEEQARLEQREHVLEQQAAELRAQLYQCQQELHPIDEAQANEANALVELERRTAWSNAQIAERDKRIAYLENELAGATLAGVELGAQCKQLEAAYDNDRRRADYHQGAHEALQTRIANALDILRTPGTWSEFASRAIKALEGK